MRIQNGITVEEVLKMECMKKCKLIAGFNGVHNTVSKVNIMADQEILDWIDQGELLLTTAYSFKLGGLKEQKSFIKECASKGLAGIGIKIYPYLESFPIEIINLANELKFPIIDLYYGTPFSDIMTPVFKEIFNKQAQELEMLQEISIRDIENKYRSEFLDDLLSMEEKRKEKAEERAHLFKLDINSTFAIVLIHTSEKDEMTIDNFDHIRINLCSALEGLLEDHNLNGLIASRTDRTYMLLSFSKKKIIDATLRALSTKLENLLVERFKKLDYKIGIGRAYEGLREVHKSYIDSLKAIQSIEKLNKKPLVFFEDLGVYKILYQDHLLEELDKFYNSTIKPLVIYDEKKSTELIKTLEAYFVYNGNLKKISEELFTHYNTILYRLERIHKITGMKLDCPSDRLSLQIGLKIKNILK